MKLIAVLIVLLGCMYTSLASVSVSEVSALTSLHSVSTMASPTKPRDFNALPEFTEVFDNGGILKLHYNKLKPLGNEQNNPTTLMTVSSYADIDIPVDKHLVTFEVEVNTKNFNNGLKSIETFYTGKYGDVKAQIQKGDSWYLKKPLGHRFNSVANSAEREMSVAADVAACEDCANKEMTYRLANTLNMLHARREAGCAIKHIRTGSFNSNEDRNTVYPAVSVSNANNPNYNQGGSYVTVGWMSKATILAEVPSACVNAVIESATGAGVTRVSGLTHMAEEESIYEGREKAENVAHVRLLKKAKDMLRTMGISSGEFQVSGISCSSSTGGSGNVFFSATNMSKESAPRMMMADSMAMGASGGGGGSEAVLSVIAADDIRINAYCNGQVSLKTN